jgi:hypothetical protein
MSIIPKRKARIASRVVTMMTGIMRMLRILGKYEEMEGEDEEMEEEEGGEMYQDPSNCNDEHETDDEFLVALMRALAPGSAHARPSAQDPINTSRDF